MTDSSVSKGIIRKNLYDIVSIIQVMQLENLEFQGLVYEHYKVEPPLFSDQIEKLVENGFLVMVEEQGKIIINRQLNPSPTQLQQNKKFWRELNRIIDQ